MISSLLTWAFFIWLVSLLARRLRRGRVLLLDKERRAFLGEWYAGLAFLFFSLGALALDYEWGEPVSWRWVWLLATVLGMAVAYKFKYTYILVTGLAMWLVWWVAEALNLALKGGLRQGIVVSGWLLMSVLMAVAGMAYLRRNKFFKFGRVFLGWSTFLLGIFYLYFSTRFGLKTVEGMSRGAKLPANNLVFYLWLCLAVSAGGFLVWAAYKKVMSRFEWAISTVSALVAVWFAAAPADLMIIGTNSNFNWRSAGALTAMGWCWALVLNVLALAFFLSLIFTGYKRQQKWAVNFGVGFMFIWSAIKYFDWFFKFLDKSLFFISAGAVLLVIGWLMERGRRYVLGEIKSK